MRHEALKPVRIRPWYDNATVRRLLSECAANPPAREEIPFSVRINPALMWTFDPKDPRVQTLHACCMVYLDAAEQAGDYAGACGGERLLSIDEAIQSAIDTAARKGRWHARHDELIDEGLTFGEIEETLAREFGDE